jgi:ssDNA-binding Zn-finger/Zn-ribbon topoisomerase 1
MKYKESVTRIKKPHSYVPCPECVGDNLLRVTYPKTEYVFVRCCSCNYEIKDWPTKALLAGQI